MSITSFNTHICQRNGGLGRAFNDNVSAYGQPRKSRSELVNRSPQSEDIIKSIYGNKTREKLQKLFLLNKGDNYLLCIFIIQRAIYWAIYFKC